MLEELTDAMKIWIFFIKARQVADRVNDEFAVISYLMIIR